MTMRAIINQGMIDALDVDFELGGDVHVLGAMTPGNRPD
jgi:hypothetical protein